MKKRIKKASEAAKRPFRKLRRRRAGELASTKVPLITNDTLAEHREEVLAGARKYIYPLQHSKHRIVLLSSMIFAIVTLVFFVYTMLNLYRFETTSNFMYRIVQIIPFPIARVEGRFVSYESYLFELRHYMHYYETQQKLSFQDEEGKIELEAFKKQAFAQAIDDAYIKQLAHKNNVSVSNQEVEEEIIIVRQQDRLGSSDQVFEDVLRNFWGWSVNDFKRSLRQQLLARKVISTLDTESRAQAEAAYAELQAGIDFGEVAQKYSQDLATRDLGGDYGITIDSANRDIPARVTSQIFNQAEGAYSAIIDTGYSLEIVKTLRFEGDKARAAHIQFIFKDITQTLEQEKTQNPPTEYLKL